MDRHTVELSALAFQAAITALLALVYHGLWRRQRRAYYATWSVAWALYAMRLGLISAYILSRRPVWLFAHQAVTGVTALLLLLAALQFSRGLTWRPRYLWLGVAAVAWAWIALYVIRDFVVAGVSDALLLSGVTLWTGVVFWNHRHRMPSTGSTLLAVAFTLWGLHHLDYPLLRPLGAGVLFGVFADVLFIVTTTVGTLVLVLGDGRRVLEARSSQLEQLTRLLLRTQEEERRRISRELHDEAGQALTAAKIELDLEGRTEASALVARALAQVRDLSNLLRPAVLDDLGLVPALRQLVEDFQRASRVEVEFDVTAGTPAFDPELEVMIYRVVQEALTNVARHAGASRVRVHLAVAGDALRLRIEDDGRGVPGDPIPNLGLLGIRERIIAAGGTLAIGGAPGAGFRIDASVPRCVTP